jgi:hypothetical protein
LLTQLFSRSVLIVLLGLELDTGNFALLRLTYQAKRPSRSAQRNFAAGCGGRSQNNLLATTFQGTWER